jgi:hypothetical protein
MRLLLSVFLLIVCSACGAATSEPAFPGASDALQIVDLNPVIASSRSRQLWAGARDVLDRRCVVCHGCYDAPCQLKLDAHDGVARGASKAPVYDPSRATAADPSRLFVDAHTIEAWRERDFHAVLPEGSARDPAASLLLRVLAMKKPLPSADDMHERFSFELDRKASCPTAEEFDDFAREHPDWGMPYALPALTKGELDAIESWVQAGAVYPGEAELAEALVAEVDRWERVLNADSNKAKLSARYLYEHLFLASLYFPALDEDVFLRLVRSTTPPGQPVAEIATRRPFDSPGEGRVYYRFTRRIGAPLAKTHMPYALHDARLKRWKAQFFDGSFEVKQLPSYEPEVASNPFKAFAAIPIKSRYTFLLDEAQFTMASFIKGPVCRGQVALNVIQERFWIAFIDPDVEWLETGSPMQTLSDMPAEGGSDAWPTAWAAYQLEHAKYVRMKAEAIRSTHERGLPIDVLWNGEGDNANAALTVVRHFDSATVAKGFVGGAPKTAWVIDYPLLERIHYLLAAGFDVFGNVSHQLMTRMYMDFLRMEGEHNFLAFLPPAERRVQIDAWYAGVEAERMKPLYDELHDSSLPAGIRYETDKPKDELLGLMAKHLSVVRSKQHELSAIDDAEVRAAMLELGRVQGVAASLWPEVTFVAVVADAEHKHDPKEEDPIDARADVFMSVLRDSAHSNVAELFNEDERRVPRDDGLTVGRGFLAAYPNLFLVVPRAELSKLVEHARAMRTPADMAAIRKAFAIERTHPRFWAFVDRAHEAYWSNVPIEAGLFDLSRLEPPMKTR